MKKLTTALLSLSLVLSLTACGPQNEAPQDDGSVNKSTSPAAAESQESSAAKTETEALPDKETTAESTAAEREKTEETAGLSLDEAISLARSFVPEGTALLTAKEDKYDYKTDFFNPETHTAYEIEIYKNGALDEIELKTVTLRAQGEPALSEEEIRAKFKEDFPLAEITDSELDDEDDGYIYEIEFTTEHFKGSVEYESVSGRILQAEIQNKSREKVPFEPADWPLDKAEKQAEVFIHPDEAVKTAQALFPEAELHDAELEEEDGRFIYEIEFVKDGKEYKAEVDCLSGEVLKMESDD